MYRFKANRLVRVLSDGLKGCNTGRSLMTTSFRPLSEQTNANSVDTYRSVTNSRNLGKDISLTLLAVLLTLLIAADLRERRLSMIKKNSYSNEYDLLSETIIKCSSIDHLLELIALHVNVMNNRQMSETFETIHDLIRDGSNYHRDCQKLLSSYEFKQLCNQVVKRSRFYQVSDLLTTLKTLVFLNVSPNTTIFQCLLQMTRQLINDFSLNDIVFLDFLLSKGIDEKSRESLDSSRSDDCNYFSYPSIIKKNLLFQCHPNHLWKSRKGRLL